MEGRSLCLQKVINSPRGLCSFVAITGLQSVQFCCSVLGCIFLYVIHVLWIRCVTFHCVLKIDSTGLYFSYFPVVVWTKSPNIYDYCLGSNWAHQNLTVRPVIYWEGCILLCLTSHLSVSLLLVLCWLLAQIPISIQPMALLSLNSTTICF